MTAAVAAARTQLDDGSWEAKWARGQAMSLEKAIAYALEKAIAYALEETTDG